MWMQLGNVDIFFTCLRCGPRWAAAWLCADPLVLFHRETQQLFPRQSSFPPDWEQLQGVSWVKDTPGIETSTHLHPGNPPGCWSTLWTRELGNLWVEQRLADPFPTTYHARSFLNIRVFDLPFKSYPGMNSLSYWTPTVSRAISSYYNLFEHVKTSQSKSPKQCCFGQVIQETAR